MIKFEHTQILGLEHAIRGMRNPMNSWDKSDSKYENTAEYKVGANDLDLMERLSKSGTDHRKFMRMITVYVDITAPLYWWKEFDTYKVGTVANSCSTMHRLTNKPFEVSDFSFEHLCGGSSDKLAEQIISVLNMYRDDYISSNDKKFWWQMIQLLPTSYNQKRTVMLNYEVLANIYKSRKNHKLDEWIDMCKWIDTLDYSNLITGVVKNE